MSEPVYTSKGINPDALKPQPETDFGGTLTRKLLREMGMPERLMERLTLPEDDEDDE